MRRREFLRTTGGLTAGAAAISGGAGVVGGQEEQPDFGGYLDGVDGGFRDARGEGEVTVSVGASGNGGSFAFEPAGVWVDSGATVVWEWTGEGGGHNVHAVSGPAEFQSDTVSEAGATFEHVFEEGGIVEYQCDPHVDLGMLGAVAVGDDVPTTTVGGNSGGGGGPSVPESVKAVGVAMALAFSATLGLAFFFLKYGGSPPESE